MFDWVKNWNGKDVATIFTSAGGILLAIYLVWSNSQISAGAASANLELTKSIVAQTEVLRDMKDNQKAQASIMQGVKETNLQMLGFLQTVFNKRP